MADPLASFRARARHPADAIRWACVLEATSPKAGNVHPGCRFANLSFGDFVAAAEITAEMLSDSAQPIGRRMHDAVRETVSATGTNVNLGIVLLLGPLVAADHRIGDRESATVAANWPAAITESLKELTPDDGQWIFRAINVAPVGGLGDADAMDVQQTVGPVDIIEAMRLAQDRDRIALQYAGDYSDLLSNIVPVVRSSIDECGDLLLGISRAHLRLLAAQPDTLIARKKGIDVALAVQRRAAEVNIDDPASVADFDRSLREQSNRLNPGTTADLIAAALYYLLRCSPDDEESDE